MNMIGGLATPESLSFSMVITDGLVFQRSSCAYFFVVARNDACTRGDMNFKYAKHLEKHK